MKKILLISILFISSLAAYSQVYSTINDVKNDINAKIIPNDTRAITPDVMKKILLGLVNFKVDTAFSRRDTIFFKRSSSTFSLKVPANASLTGVTGFGGPNDPVPGLPFYTNTKLIGLGARLQIFIDEIPLQNYGNNASFTFDPITGEIDLSPNVFVVGSSLRIYLNQ